MRRWCGCGGCGGGDGKEAATTTAKGSLPPGCSVAEVESIVNRFLDRPDLAPPGFFQGAVHDALS